MELWQKLLIYAAISLVVKLIISGMRADRTAENGIASNTVGDPTPYAPTAGHNKKALLSDPTKMIDRGLVFMACLTDRKSLDQVGRLQVRHFCEGDVATVQTVGQFAKTAFELERVSADGFRTLLLSAMLNKRYHAPNLADPVDTTMANIAFGLAVLSQNTLLETTEEEAWRLLLLSKAREIYADYDAAYRSLDRYHRAALKNFVQTQNRTAHEGAPADYQRQLAKDADAARKAAVRLDKQMNALSTLNADPDWKRHMNKSWADFRPVRFDEVTKVARSRT